MPVPTLTRDRLRRLAELRPQQGRVLSVFLNLDPSEFATGAARSTAITSIIHDATHRVESCEGLDHDAHQALRADVERVREVLNGSDIARDGTKGVAVFACGPADLLEVVRLGHPIESQAIINDTPFVEPLVMAGEDERWCILLVNRKVARFLHGTAEGFEEIELVQDETRSQSSQGGPNQSRYERSVEEEKRSHLQNAADELFRMLRRRPFDHLLVGTPPELTKELEGHLHPYLSERLAGRLSVDVENPTVDQIRQAAAPLIEEHVAKVEREALDRLAQGAGRGERAAVGLQSTLEALNEFRVETLLVEQGFSADGMVEAKTGMLTADSGVVPVEDPQLEPVEDILEPAIEKAMEQSAKVLVVRHHPDLEAHGGIGAVLRF